MERERERTEGCVVVKVGKEGKGRRWTDTCRMSRVKTVKGRSPGRERRRVFRDETVKEESPGRERERVV